MDLGQWYLELRLFPDRGAQNRPQDPEAHRSGPSRYAAEPATIFLSIADVGDMCHGKAPGEAATRE